MVSPSNDQRVHENLLCGVRLSLAEVGSALCALERGSVNVSELSKRQIAEHTEKILRLLGETQSGLPSSTLKATGRTLAALSERLVPHCVDGEALYAVQQHIYFIGTLINDGVSPTFVNAYLKASNQLGKASVSYRPDICELEERVAGWYPKDSAKSGLRHFADDGLKAYTNDRAAVIREIVLLFEQHSDPGLRGRVSTCLVQLFQGLCQDCAVAELIDAQARKMVTDLPALAAKAMLDFDPKRTCAIVTQAANHKDGSKLVGAKLWHLLHSHTATL